MLRAEAGNRLRKCSCCVLIGSKGKPERQQPMAHISIREMTRQACAETGQPIPEIMGKSRKAELCRVRERIWLRAHEAGFSSAQIGRVFKRDHTSILHGIRNARQDTSAENAPR